MGKKAKLKKIRQQQKAGSKSQPKYDKTKFVEQFTHMGYQVQVDPKLQPKTNRGNVAPELPRNDIEPQL
ncbi:MAG: hypothetical protein AAGE84_26885 [Cyanobacteria bacterium P01_G01_bin.39]